MKDVLVRWPSSSKMPAPWSSFSKAPVPSPSSSKVAVPAPFLGPAMVMPAPGGSLRPVFFQDLSPFEDALSDPSCSWVTLQLQAVDLHSVRAREMGMAGELMKHVENRAEIMSDLADQLVAAAQEAKGGGIDDEGGKKWPVGMGHRGGVGEGRALPWETHELLMDSKGRFAWEPL